MLSVPRGLQIARVEMAIKKCRALVETLAGVGNLVEIKEKSKGFLSQLIRDVVT